MAYNILILAIITIKPATGNVESFQIISITLLFYDFYALIHSYIIGVVVNYWLIPTELVSFYYFG